MMIKRIGIIVLLLVVILIVIWGYKLFCHSGTQIYSLKNDLYEVSVEKFEGGVGTSSFLIVYCVDNKSKRKVTTIDPVDSLRLAFVSPDTLQIIVRDSFYDNKLQFHWGNSDTLYFDLSNIK